MKRGPSVPFFIFSRLVKVTIDVQGMINRSESVHTARSPDDLLYPGITELNNYSCFNVNEMVMEVFQMTGFSDVLKIE